MRALLICDRIRRVKCDETKPKCLRCGKFGRVCDGYDIKTSCPPKPTTPKPSSRSRQLLPIILAPLAPVPPGPRLPTTISFQDEQQAQYFQFFQSETAAALSGGFPTTLWNRIVLQACVDEPCILQCTVAISALGKACKVKASPLANTYEVHHQYALQQYGKALERLREITSNGEDTFRVVLLASLLIFCFESFHGDVRLALKHVEHAVELMHGWLSSNVGHTDRKGFSPAPHIIEDEVVTAYSRLDIHVMSWLDTPQPSRTSIIKFAVTEPQPMPKSFGTLTEAKTFFDDIGNRVFQFLETPREAKPKIPATPAGMQKILSTDQGLPSQDPPVAKELREWSAAFKLVLANARTPAGYLDFVGALTLRVHVLTLELSLRSYFFNETDIQPYDTFLPEYCEIVALCKSVTEHHRFVKSFIFDTGIVGPLFVIVTKCRDRMLRQEAISVLKKASSRREGVWDALMVARVGEALLEYEGEDDEMKERNWVEIHLTCLNTTIQLPKPPGGEDGNEERHDGRGYLLDWVEKSMKLNSVGEVKRI